MSGFDKALAFSLPHEGGYVNNPKDPGGETKFGISKRSYPDIDIRSLTAEDASQIYKRDFWDNLHLDGLPVSVAIAMFDAAINIGVVPATKILQESCNFYPNTNLEVDGLLGAKTISTVNRICTLPNGQSTFLARMLARRSAYYTSLAERKPVMKVFLKGWLNRVNSLSDYISKVAL